jgi:hypothetical protein
MVYAFLRLFIAVGGSVVSGFLHHDTGLVWYLALGLPIPLVYWALSKVHGIGFLKASELEEKQPEVYGSDIVLNLFVRPMFLYIVAAAVMIFAIS